MNGKIDAAPVGVSPNELSVTVSSRKEIKEREKDHKRVKVRVFRTLCV